MIKTIAIISNLRMLFIFLLINKENIDNVLFIFDNSYKINHNINKFIQLNKAKGIFDLIWKTFLYSIKFKLTSKKFNLDKNISVYGADHIIGSKYFLKRYNFILLEDGTINYSPKAYIRSIKNKLFSIPSYGVYKNVKKIILTKNHNIPKLIEHKTEFINLNKVWNSKNKSEQKKILSILNINLENIYKLKSRSYILYTQPLSEDGIISEKEKIELYNKILDSYDISKLVIKPHPREITDYSLYFKKAYIFCDNIPSELLPILGIEFDKAITLFSTAVLQHKKENIISFGTTIHPKIYEHFGDIEL